MDLVRQSLCHDDRFSYVEAHTITRLTSGVFVELREGIACNMCAAIAPRGSVCAVAAQSGRR